MILSLTGIHKVLGVPVILGAQEAILNLLLQLVCCPRNFNMLESEKLERLLKPGGSE